MVRKKEQTKKQNIFKRLLYGNVVTAEFFGRHWIKFFLLVIIVMVYISTKYQCMTNMESIKKLENDLNIVKTESVRERSDYMSRIRESSMQQMVDSLIPGLKVPVQPPYVLNSPKTTE